MSLSTTREPSALPSPGGKITFSLLNEKKRAGEPITALTAYDYPTARIVDEAGIDLLLVGDSLGMAVLGYDSTLPVTLDEMLHHTRAVRRAVKRVLLVADMPFGTYHADGLEAVRNATRLLKEAGAEAVKIEGARPQLAVRLVEAEIPVVAHLGLLPQGVHRMGGYKVQARTVHDAELLLRDALAMEGAGCALLVLEGVPREVAARITEALHIPVIGIGAGIGCDGQILVLHDILSLTFAPSAKFLRRYADLGASMREAVAQYAEDVRERRFPSEAESYHLSAEIQAAWDGLPSGTKALMHVARTIAEVRAFRLNAVSSLGFIPTMGALHAGHLSLVEAARTADEQVVASIFVNPTQFGPTEDFSKYPRTFDADCALLEQAGVALLFAPTPQEMYPAGFATAIDVGPVATRLDGASRPGHFIGVATVVAKLLNIVMPTRAYFGQKDAAQIAVLRQLVRDLSLPVELVVCPTVREPDGLALSSRNHYLSPAERAQALVLSHALLAAEDKVRHGVRDAEVLLETAGVVLAQQPGFRLDYCALVDPDTLEAVALMTPDTPALLAIAGWIGTTRLIDNVLLNER